VAQLELRAISKSFRGTAVLRDISLLVPDGSLTILLGPSGCGKSTLLRIIAGLEEQNKGQVLIAGTPVDTLPPADRDIAMVFQQYALYPHLSVRENLAFALKMRRTPPAVIEERIAEAAQLLGIQLLLDRKPRELSGGQRQRVAMGRAIVRKPKLFLFDEPLSNLDAQLRTTMRVELKKLQRRLNATMMYVTHDQVEAMTLGDQIVVMEGGAVRQVDAPNRLYTEPANPFVASFIGTPPMNLWEGALIKTPQGLLFRSNGFELSVPANYVAPVRPEGSAAVLGIRPEDIAFEAGTDGIPMTVVADIIEELGAERLLHGRIGQAAITVRTTLSISALPGQPMQLFLPASRLHLFQQDRRLLRLVHAST
jgi:ABC-type sugar transport system ATPase subunit